MLFMFFVTRKMRRNCGTVHWGCQWRTTSWASRRTRFVIRTSRVVSMPNCHWSPLFLTTSFFVQWTFLSLSVLFCRYFRTVSAFLRFTSLRVALTLLVIWVSLVSRNQVRVKVTPIDIFIDFALILELVLITKVFLKYRGAPLILALINFGLIDSVQLKPSVASFKLHVAPLHLTLVVCGTNVLSHWLRLAHRLVHCVSKFLLSASHRLSLVDRTLCSLFLCWTIQFLLQKLLLLLHLVFLSLNLSANLLLQAVEVDLKPHKVSDDQTELEPGKQNYEHVKSQLIWVQVWIGVN